MSFYNRVLRMMSQEDAYTDVVELCALLQCLGFSVKSLDSNDHNVSQDAGTRTVVINCQLSGLHVVLESGSLSCSCPNPSHQNSGIWQVSGVTGGKQLDKEFGWSLLGSLPKSHRDRLNKELHEMIRCIKQHNESDVEPPKEKQMTTPNRSVSMVELQTPEKRNFKLKVDTPGRYRSLDTLTADNKEVEPLFPAPGPISRLRDEIASEASINEDKVSMCSRQSTYTISSSPDKLRLRSKTSSPIHVSRNFAIFENLLAVEKHAEELHKQLAIIIKEFPEAGNNDSSMCSLALDVSKISVLKCAETSKAQFASSPNLSGLGGVKEDLTKSKLKRFESASTSNLTKFETNKDVKTSRIRRLPTNLFKTKKEISKTDKTCNAKSRLPSLFKSKIGTPIQNSMTEQSPNTSSSRKKYSHIKSTIPKPLKKE